MRVSLFLHAQPEGGRRNCWRNRRDRVGDCSAGGICSVETSRGKWHRIGDRDTVFDGLPFSVYVPPNTKFRITADTGCDLAFCYSRAEEEHPARLIAPEDVEIEIRGGGNATRKIHNIVPPSFPAHRLIVVEVFTPAGN